ncbi:MAG: NAD(P)-dependent oxidoreductase [Pseudomonadota bacterium]
MTSVMQQFVKVAQAYPEKSAPEQRQQNFRELYQPFTMNAAKAQSARCAQCGVPFCQIHCPVANTIPDWLGASASGHMRDAWDLLSQTTTLPEICGRICPQDRLCEGNCVIEQSGHGSVTIGSIERMITEHAWAQGWIEPIRPASETGLTVAIIGAGPGGLAAAHRLREDGHGVTIFDRYDRAGGMLIYGIPGFKLEKDAVLRRTELLQASGVAFELGVNVGQDIEFDDIRTRFDAVIIATGVYRPRQLTLDGCDLPGIHPALSYLIASNRKGLGDHVAEFDDGTLNAAGRNVVVIGGGDTAMDCVRTAIRQQAQSVSCLYRRDQANMPGSAREVIHAEEEGVVFNWLKVPEGFVADVSGNHVGAVQTCQMRLGAPDMTGRREPKRIDQPSAIQTADLVLLALGFEAEADHESLGAPALERTRWGTVAVQGPMRQTNLPGVFAVGDIVRGASLVVWAVRDGQMAARAVSDYLAERAGTSPASTPFGIRAA